MANERQGKTELPSTKKLCKIGVKCSMQQPRSQGQVGPKIKLHSKCLMHPLTLGSESGPEQKIIGRFFLAAAAAAAAACLTREFVQEWLLGNVATAACDI